MLKCAHISRWARPRTPLAQRAHRDRCTNLMLRATGSGTPRACAARGSAPLYCNQYEADGVHSTPFRLHTTCDCAQCNAHHQRAAPVQILQSLNHLRCMHTSRGGCRTPSGAAPNSAQRVGGPLGRFTRRKLSWKNTMIYLGRKVVSISRALLPIRSVSLHAS